VVPGDSSARETPMDHRKLGTDARPKPAGQVLPVDRCRQEAAGQRTFEMAATRAGDWAGDGAGVGGRPWLISVSGAGANAKTTSWTASLTFTSHSKLRNSWRRVSLSVMRSSLRIGHSAVWRWRKMS